MTEKSPALQAAQAFDRVQMMIRKRDEKVAAVTAERDRDIAEYIAGLPADVREVFDRIAGGGV